MDSLPGRPLTHKAKALGPPANDAPPEKSKRRGCHKSEDGHPVRHDREVHRVLAPAFDDLPGSIERADARPLNRNTSAVDLKFLSDRAARSVKELQIQNRTRNIYLLVLL